MKVKKIFHVRAPLVIKNIIGKREVSPTVVHDRLSTHGGCTIVVEGDTDNPGFVQMKSSFCRWSDNYNKKLGIKTAEAKDPEVVPLRLLARELSNIEKKMLLQTTPYLRKEKNETAQEALWLCRQDWGFVTAYFLPTKKEEVV